MRAKSKTAFKILAVVINVKILAIMVLSLFYSRGSLGAYFSVTIPCTLMVLGTAAAFIGVWLVDLLITFVCYLRHTRTNRIVP